MQKVSSSNCGRLYHETQTASNIHCDSETLADLHCRHLGMFFLKLGVYHVIPLNGMPCFIASLGLLADQENRGRTEVQVMVAVNGSLQRPPHLHTYKPHFNIIRTFKSVCSKFSSLSLNNTAEVNYIYLFIYLFMYFLNFTSAKASKKMMNMNIESFSFYSQHELLF